MPGQEQLVLGIDGGGTKTVAWLAPRHDPSARTILGRGVAGPANPRAAGVDAALANLQAAIDSAFADARLPRQTVAAVCFGLAGAGRPAEQERIRAWAYANAIAERAQVTSDAEPILAAASPDNTGLALISGTGSFAWGRNAAGQSARCGGWGFLLGDEGSGYAIAVAGLRAAVRAADGRGPPTELTERLQRLLGADTPAAFIDLVYDPAMTRQRIAALAATVFEAAPSDEVARGIIDFAAAELAELVRALTARLDFSASRYLLALAGGVLLNQPRLRELLLVHLQDRGAAPASVALVSDPARGALLLARLAAASSTGKGDL